ncbi:MAG: EAL domain-containing protein [Pseudorhodoplanes sp.]|nr:EAL domain-containing protein [Pseudorhodoplanes sp.]
MSPTDDDRLSDAAPHSAGHAQLFRELINLLPVGITVRAQDGRIVIANDAATAQFGPAGSGQTPSVIEVRGGADGARTFLTTQKPLPVAGEALTVTASFDITERKLAEDELRRRACYDELTGLANRRIAQQQVQALIENMDLAGRFALAFIDIDNFKHINDYYSHAIGDALLVKLAQRIGGLARETDLLARISGDEFVLVLYPVEDVAQLETLVSDLLRLIRQPFHIEGFEILTSASVGVSVYPDHGRDYETLRRNADAAMYRAKGTAKGAAVFFDADVGTAMEQRMRLEQRLRLAIRDRQFICAFQPKVDLRSHEVVGFEALVRLRDADGEIQGPNDFVSLAIELGLIDCITRQVVAQTAKSIDALDDAFGSGTTFSINIAARQAGDMTFMRSVAGLLDDTGHAGRFMIEVTEEAFLHRTAFQKQIMPMLRELGVRVSIDDFGTGYSSLSVLSDITADEIKVDRSFITAIHQRPRSQSVLKAIESLSHALGMSIVAEGVETFEELAYLQAATRIHLAQGYYFSQPFLLEDMASRVARGERNAAALRERPQTRSAAGGRAGRARA